MSKIWKFLFGLSLTLNAVFLLSDYVIKPAPVGLPGRTFVVDSDGFSAQGTWSGAETDLAFPDQVTAYQCSKMQRICWEATAVYHEKTRALFPLKLISYPILFWEANTVRVQTEEGGCKTSYITFDLTKKTALAISSPKTNALEVCGSIDRSSLTLVLADGHELSRLRRSAQR
ncbi:MAG: hypothetical protein RLZ98_2524 [Pseudomonadota bacterium]|jgi:hypothetical protein